jgi:hypothetical protein
MNTMAAITRSRANMHAQRGSKLGNGTADEHSETLMRPHEPNVAITAGPCQPPTGDQLVVPSGIIGVGKTVFDVSCLPDGSRAIQPPAFTPILLFLLGRSTNWPATPLAATGR